MAFTAKILICNVVTAPKTDTVRQAASTMKTAGIGSIVVVEKDKPVGMFSERDLLGRVVVPGLDPAKTLLETVMTPNPVCLDCSEPLEKVFSILAEGRFRHLPITDGGSVVGIVSIHDLAKMLSQVLRKEEHVEYFADYIQRSSAAA
ncbi:MAG: CBS domain-containing protein [Elusimicrobia bacterium]|nr:CBS domain-containing protein [Elusimicrobiota bacterium]